jgi:hypothetical protein
MGKQQRFRLCSMNAPSPGPGWWLTEEGNWHPPRWESKFIYFTHESLDGLVEGVHPVVAAHGLQGWEVVSSSIDRTATGSTPTGSGWKPASTWKFLYSMVVTLKRPLPPGGQGEQSEQQA